MKRIVKMRYMVGTFLETDSQNVVAFKGSGVSMFHTKLVTIRNLVWIILVIPLHSPKLFWEFIPISYVELYTQPTPSVNIMVQGRADGYQLYQ